MKNNNKNIHFFAIAALAATLMAGQIPVSPVYAESNSVQLSSLIPDNVTIEEPKPLSDISLPDSEYGTLSWADGSSVPSERVQSYEVVFKPYDTSVLSQISGWDGESDAIYGSVTVVVNSIGSNSEETGEYKDDSEGNYDENYNDSEAKNDGYQDNYDENQNSSEVKEDQKTDSEEQNDEQNSEQPAETDQEGEEAPSEEENKETAEITEKPSEEADQKAENEENTAETPESDAGDKAEDEKKTPETTETPDATETPAVTETPNITETPEVTEAPEATVTPETTATPAADKDNIFDGADKDIKKDERSTEYEENLTEEQQTELAEANHSCNGITVSGIDLPYYVQFRVASGDDYEFTNESEANVFQSYEFELWDLKNNTEYEVPDGEYVSVTVPVKAGYSYTIEHLLDSGAMETIVPSVDGSTMVFSTHSFSPFGIAGSKTLVGEEIEEAGYDTGVVTETPDAADAALTPVADDTTSSDATANTDAAASTNTGAASTVTENTNTSEVTEAPESTDTTAQTAESSDETQDNEEDGSSSVSAVHTNDPTTILPFVILAAAAAVIVGVIVYLRKKKK